MIILNYCKARDMGGIWRDFVEVFFLCNRQENMSKFMQQHNNYERVDIIQIFGCKTKMWILGDQAGGGLS